MTGSAEPLRVAILGAGRIAGIHLAAFARHDDVELVALADTKIERAEARAGRHGIARVYGDYRALLAQERPDLVDVVLPHHVHFEAARAALGLGCAVLCEKPLALTLAECDELIELAATEGLGLHVKSYHRAFPLNRRAAELVASDAIGRPYLVTGFFASTGLRAMEEDADWHGCPTRAGGGVLIDCGYHLVDWLHSLLGPASAVRATARRLVCENANKAEDVGALTIEFVDGTVATVTCTWADTSLPFRWERAIYGTAGSLALTAEGSYDTLVLARDGRRDAPIRQPAYWETANLGAIDDVLAAVRAGRSDLESAREARRTLATVLAAYEAADTGREVSLAVHP